MKNLIKISIVCAFLIAMSAIAANAQTNPNPSYWKIDGPDIMGHFSVGYFTVPQESGASYVWSTGGFLVGFSGGGNGGSSAGAGFVSPLYYLMQGSNPPSWWECIGGPFCPCMGCYNPYGPPMVFIPWDDGCWVQCVVTLSNGQTFRLKKDIFISKNY